MTLNNVWLFNIESDFENIKTSMIWFYLPEIHTDLQVSSSSKLFLEALRPRKRNCSHWALSGLKLHRSTASLPRPAWENSSRHDLFWAQSKKRLYKLCGTKDLRYKWLAIKTQHAENSPLPANFKPKIRKITPNTQVFSSNIVKTNIWNVIEYEIIDNDIWSLKNISAGNGCYLILKCRSKTRLIVACLLLNC